MTGNGPTPNHTYEEGRFNVILTVTDDLGVEDSSNAFTVIPEAGRSVSAVAALAALGSVCRWRRKGSDGTA
jgi:hypothetical protein